MDEPRTASILRRAVLAKGYQAVADSFTSEQWERIRWEWEMWALPEQLEPGTPFASSPRTDWDIWMMLAGRGSGKTQAGSQWVSRFAMAHPGCRIALIARTAGDVRTTMIEGPSGLLNVGHPSTRPTHNPSAARLTWPNGSIALHFSAEEPKGLRGPQFHAAWCDELASWPCVRQEDGEPGIPSAWSQLQFGVRMPGAASPIIVTTTPRPTPVIKGLVDNPRCVITKWSTFDNAHNLSEAFIAKARQLASSRLGRQEIHADLLLDVPGALWTLGVLESGRVNACPVELRRVVVAVDPSGGSEEQHDEQGIVVVALGLDGHGYVLEDCTCKLTPDGWGKVAVRAYQRHQADRVVFEKNFGGAMVEHVISMAARDLGVRVATKDVQASRGKIVRAEPVAALYEQGRVHHVGYFKELEEQMCHFTPTGEFDESPDRADALVWALTELMLGETLDPPHGFALGVRRVDEQNDMDGDDGDDDYGSGSDKPWLRR